MSYRSSNHYHHDIIVKNVNNVIFFFFRIDMPTAIDHNIVFLLYFVNVGPCFCHVDRSIYCATTTQLHMRLLYRHYIESFVFFVEQTVSEVPALLQNAKLQEYAIKLQTETAQPSSHLSLVDVPQQIYNCYLSHHKCVFISEPFATLHTCL